jgi:cell division septum initiation protein DivIVA
MTDSRLRGRVKGLFAGTSGDNEMLEEPTPPAFADPDVERQALQVLVLAQRTADEHISSVQHEAHKIRSEAQARAEDVARDAQADAEAARRDADKVLSDARAKAAQLTRDAQANADAARRKTEKILSDAHAKAAQIGKDAQAKADGLEREAQARYDGVVGSLEAKRATLRQQITALKQFDREYRTRLATFMQSQLRALGVDEPHLQVPFDQLDFDDDSAPSSTGMAV